MHFFFFFHFYGAFSLVWFLLFVEVHLFYFFLKKRSPKKRESNSNTKIDATRKGSKEGQNLLRLFFFVFCFVFFLFFLKSLPYLFLVPVFLTEMKKKTNKRNTLRHTNKEKRRRKKERESAHSAHTHTHTQTHTHAHIHRTYTKKNRKPTKRKNTHIPTLPLTSLSLWSLIFSLCAFFLFSLALCFGRRTQCNTQTRTVHTHTQKHTYTHFFCSFALKKEITHTHTRHIP
eukprot:TRINITY_DN6299_c0_g2_i1.p2 TRINITY_DN6299_c0_g2~~TRINITY_DN6299_c0_g2_i1.p2  ORF type:complete len:230 (+),score=10.54 TRINITY_DN6299_c0_g2_i1:496-1185(+)